MTSKVDSPLHLNDDGSQISVTGPIERWDLGEQWATFAVVIAQVNDAGTIVAASGTSESYESGATWWDASAAVADSSPRFVAGPAKAFAVAAIEVTGAPPKPYYWEVDIELRAPGTAA
ncbi:MAG TPA: hypothetical protein VLB81_12140 [Gaiellales bacterium]|nr:hypothetical protein [Gaiellales bacterium]